MSVLYAVESTYVRMSKISSNIKNPQYKSQWIFLCKKNVFIVIHGMKYNTSKSTLNFSLISKDMQNRLVGQI